MIVSIAGYRFNLRNLLGRICYRWRVQSVLVLLLVIGVLGIGSGSIPPLWRSGATLHIAAPAGARVQLNDATWPTRVFAGAQQVQAQLPDGRISWASFALQASQVMTLTMPAGLPAPKEQTLPAAAPGSAVDQVYFADGAWRVHSQPVIKPTPEGSSNNGQPTPTPGTGQTLSVGHTLTERLPTLDAYGGLADQVKIGETLHEAVFRPNKATYNTSIVGSLEVRGWAKPVTVPFSNSLSLVRFAPDGTSLLVSEQVADGGEQVSVLRDGQSLIPAVAVPGHVTRLIWRDDGSAAVIASVQQHHLTFTLLRLAPTIAAAVILERDANPGSLIPLAWDRDGLRWIALDTASVSALWHAPLATLIPERVQTLNAIALTMLPDGTMRTMRVVDDQVVIGRVDGDLWIGEARLRQVTPDADLVGLWRGADVLLMNHDQAWIVTVTEGGA